ncbi:TPA: transposase [Salmonella enterica subsp. enterica serovar 1,4,[5],12:b:-]
MKKTRYTEEQIAFALKQAETGTRVGEVCRKMGISEATFYNWKKNVRVYSTTDIRSKKNFFRIFLVWDHIT